MTLWHSVSVKTSFFYYRIAFQSNWSSQVVENRQVNGKRLCQKWGVVCSFCHSTPLTNWNGPDCRNEDIYLPFGGSENHANQRAKPLVGVWLYTVLPCFSPQSCFSGEPPPLRPGQISVATTLPLRKAWRSSTKMPRGGGPFAEDAQSRRWAQACMAELKNLQVADDFAFFTSLDGINFWVIAFFCPWKRLIDHPETGAGGMTLEQWTYCRAAGYRITCLQRISTHVPPQLLSLVHQFRYEHRVFYTERVVPGIEESCQALSDPIRLTQVVSRNVTQLGVGQTEEVREVVDNQLVGCLSQSKVWRHRFKGVCYCEVSKIPLHSGEYDIMSVYLRAVSCSIPLPIGWLLVLWSVANSLPCAVALTKQMPTIDSYNSPG